MLEKFACHADTGTKHRVWELKLGDEMYSDIFFNVNPAEEVKVELAFYADTGTKPGAVWELKLGDEMYSEINLMWIQRRK